MKVVPIVPVSSGGDGNTKSPPKQIAPCKNWCFTLNNYTRKDIDAISSNSSIFKYVFQEETGETGTPHLQGFIQFKKKLRPKNLFPKEIHWEKCRNKKASIDYCTKDESRTGEIFTNIKFPRKFTLDLKLYSWEQDIVKILKGEPDDRLIYWIWESMGNIGKTTFCKWVYLNFDDVVVLSGKATDMKHQIVKYQEIHKDTPKIIIVDYPRGRNIEWLSYSGLEEIKNMFFFSPKYEGGMICGFPPHLLIFANEEPNYYKFSEDRWKVINLNAHNQSQSVVNPRRVNHDCFD